MELGKVSEILQNEKSNRMAVRLGIESIIVHVFAVLYIGNTRHGPSCY